MKKFDKVTEKARKVNKVFVKISSLILTTVAVILLFMAFAGVFDDVASEYLGYGKKDSDVQTFNVIKDNKTEEPKKETTTTEEPKKETTTTEEPKKETTTTEEPKSKEEISSEFGYPEQEKELVKAKVDITDITSKECFLYTYAEFKVLQEHLNVNMMQDIYDWVHNNTTDAFETDYAYIDTMMFSEDNLFDHMSKYLVPLVGDEWQDIINKALEDYNGTNTDDYSETTQVIDYIAGLENTDIYDIYIENYGNKTKDDIYYNASYIASNIESIQFNKYSKEFVRDLDNNVGQPMMYSGQVSYSHDNYASIAYVPDYIGEGEPSEIIVDTSYVTTNLLHLDNVTVYGVYLGLNKSNIPVLLALSIIIN